MTALELLARVRPDTVDGQALIAVRWLTAPTLGPPPNGFTLNREVGGRVTPLFANRRLPGAVENPANGTWSIDLNQLRIDANARRTIVGGVEVGIAVPAWSDVEPLAPVLAFALANPDSDVLEQMLAPLAKLRGDAHRADPALIVRHWSHLPSRVPPPIDAICAMRSSGSADERELYEDVIDFYSRDAANFLFVCAAHFGFAKLLGWGIDDLLPEGVDPVASRPRYTVTAGYAQPISRRAPPFPPDAPYPTAPSDLDEALPTDFKVPPSEGLVGYPPFAPLFAGDGRWHPAMPSSAGTLSDSARKRLADQIATADKGPRCWPTPVVPLRWTKPPPDPRDPEREPGHEHDPDDERGQWLLTLSAHFWQVEVFPFGANQPPALPAMPAFKPCPEGARLWARPINLFVHGVDLPWGAVPLEGWYAYRVRGIDLFGIVGPASNVVTLLRRDSNAPPPPILATAESAVVLNPADNDLEVMLGWDAEREYRAPDTIEYRIGQHWTGLAHVPVEVKSVTPAQGLRGYLLVSVELTMDGAPLDDAILATATGGRLFTRGGEFEIAGPGLPGTGVLELRRSAGREPPLGAATLRHVEPETHGSLPSVPRTRPQPATAFLVSLNPFIVTLKTVDGTTAIVPADGRVHLHLLGDEFTARANLTRFELAPPPARSRSAGILEALAALPLNEAQAWIDGSPALFLPRQTILLRLAPPANFGVGTVRILATAADGAPYVTVNGKVGNESAEAERILTATDPTPPAAIALQPPKIWANGATDYLETAEATLHWPRVAGAMRYEIERALEQRLGGVGADDDALLALAAASGADGAFERISGYAFGAAWTDALPGRVPVRAIYRARAVSPAGIAGSPWAIVALVRVPDIRVPVPPNLLAVKPLAKPERALGLTWTQAGPLAGIGFQVEARPARDGLADEEGWSVLADYLPTMLEPRRGQYFETIITGVTPGIRQQLRLRAVRHALDPRDPRARLTRRIEGRASPIAEAFALGDLLPPRDLRVHRVGDRVTIEWRNAEPYDLIELRRRAPGRFGFERIPLASYAERFEEHGKLALGSWAYELGVSVPGSYARSERIVIEIKAPGA